MNAKTLTRSFDVKKDQTSTVRITICEPDLRADNLPFLTWTASFILADALYKLDIPLSQDLNDNGRIPVIELGAGTGLVGLTLAALHKTKVILTDLPGVVTGIRDNINANTNILHESGSVVEAGALDWFQASDLILDDDTKISAKRTKAQVIVAADTIYDEEHPEILANAMLTWLDHSRDARAILCYALRPAYLDYVRGTWENLENAGLVEVSTEQVIADGKIWDDELLCEIAVFKWKGL